MNLSLAAAAAAAVALDAMKAVSFSLLFFMDVVVVFCYDGCRYYHCFCSCY